MSDCSSRGTRAGGQSAVKRKELGQQLFHRPSQSMHAVDHMEHGRELRPPDDDHLNAQLLRRTAFLHKPASRAALLHQDGVRADAPQQFPFIFPGLVEAELIQSGSLLPCETERTVAVEDPINNSEFVGFECSQSGYRLHAGGGQKNSLQRRQLVIPVNPRQRQVARRIDAFITDGRNRQVRRDTGHRVVQLAGERMGRVDQQTYAMLSAKRAHLPIVHRTAHGRAMMQCHVLLAGLRGIEEGASCLLHHFHCLTPFGGSSKNQYHLSVSVPFR